MVEGSYFQSNTKTAISAVELKRLLVSIAHYTPNVCFRCRLMGQLWMRTHKKIISVDENSVLLLDEKLQHYISVKINHIMEFDLDERFQNYQPNFHYKVIASTEIE